MSNKIILFLLFNFTLINCRSAQYGLPSNVLFTSTGTTGYSGSSYNIKDKFGEACVTSLFGLFAVGNASIERAASKAGIIKISNIDHESRLNYLVLTDLCTIVRGQ